MIGLNCTVAVFFGAGFTAMLSLDDDAHEAGSAELACRGFTFIGSVAVVDGEPKALIEPGYEARFLLAAPHLAEWLAPRVRAWQLEKEGN